MIGINLKRKIVVATLMMSLIICAVGCTKRSSSSQTGESNNDSSVLTSVTDANTIAAVGDFMKYFLDKPVMDSFDSTDYIYDVTEFMAYKLLYENSDKIIKNSDGKYEISWNDIYESASKYFDVVGMNFDDVKSKIDEYGRISSINMGYSEDGITFTEMYKSTGGTPVIDEINSTGSEYMVTGHIAELEGTEKNNEVDGGPIVYDFTAVLTIDANGGYLLKSLSY